MNGAHVAAAGALLVACGASVVTRESPTALPADVAALVNGEPIAMAAVEAAAASALAHESVYATPAERAPFLARALDGLIEALLIEQVALALGVEVTDAEVEAAISTVHEQQGQPPPVIDAEFRANVRRMVLRFRVGVARMGPRVTISEEEVRRHYDEIVGRLTQPGTPPSFESLHDDLLRQMRESAIQQLEPTMMRELREQAVIERAAACSP